MPLVLRSLNILNLILVRRELVIKGKSSSVLKAGIWIIIVKDVVKL